MTKIDKEREEAAKLQRKAEIAALDYYGTDELIGGTDFVVGYLDGWEAAKRQTTNEPCCEHKALFLRGVKEARSRAKENFNKEN